MFTHFLNYRAIFIFFIAFAASLAQAQITFPVERHVLKSGDTWKYQRIDLWKNEKTGETSELIVNSVTDKTVRLSGKGFTQNPFTRTETLEGNTFPTVRGEVQNLNYMIFPLKDDHTWEFKFLWAFNEFEGETTEKCKIKGTEKVTVPAGTFDTVKIICEGIWSSRNGGGGSQELSTWYSPQVKRGIKFMYKQWQGSRLDTQRVDELVEYKIAP